MIGRVRILILVVRPAVVVLFGLFAAIGLGHAGRGEDPMLLATVLVVVVAFVVFSVVVNDLADEAIDRVNLPDDPWRPLVTQTATRQEFAVIAVTSAVVAVAASALLHWPAVVVVLAGLAFSLGYSLRPIRIADRGAVASLLLPAGYVAVPFLVGIFGARSHVRPADLLLLGGLYVGFIGRILLKDFRDVRGDALFGKRTFLVRHGRRRTCAISGVCWIAGSVALAGARTPTPALAGAYILYVLVALVLLRALSTECGARRDEAHISAVALVGRGMIVTLLAHYSMTDAAWSSLPYCTVMVVLTGVILGAVTTMARQGPRTRLTVPTDWVCASTAPVRPMAEAVTTPPMGQLASENAGTVCDLGGR